MYVGDVFRIGEAEIDDSDSRREGRLIIKPLFVPLKREYYEAFRSGQKTTEYRKYGPRWNENTGYKGRSVILSLGYGRKHRLFGDIVWAFKEADMKFHKGYQEIYGDEPAWCMEIRLSDWGNEAELKRL